MSVPTPRKYWSERQGRGPIAAPLDFERVKALALTVVQEFNDKDYLVGSFGQYCVDNDWMDGALGHTPERWFLLNLNRDNIWPVAQHGASYDADTFFDVVEALHDLVSKPLDGHFHNFAGCGMHWHTFDDAAGKEEFRAALNPLLARYETPLELSPAGEILALAPDDLRPLLEAPLPASADDELVVSKVQSAVALYRGRNASASDRRHAVRDLADALEALRAETKEEMLPKDERDLFHIANGFGIRHNNREQRSDYDKPAWLAWAFYVYLATIHVVLHLKERHQASAASTAGVE